MAWQDWIALAEFIVVFLILVYEIKGVGIERKNHTLYKDYFESRKAWYAARTKKRSDVGGDGDAGAPAVSDGGGSEAGASAGAGTASVEGASAPAASPKRAA